MAAPTPVGVSNTTYVGATSVSVQPHASSLPGDWCGVIICNQGAIGVTAPDGTWTISSMAGQTINGLLAYKRLPDDWDGSAFVFSFAATESGRAVAFTVRGTDPTTGLNVLGEWSFNPLTGALSTMPGVVTTVADTLLIGIVMAPISTVLSYTFPSPWATTWFDANAARSVGIGYQELATAQTVADRDATINIAYASVRRNIMLALAPVAASAPSATSVAASSVTSTTATLNGTVTANGAETTAQFEYGTASNLAGATTVTAAESPVASGGSGVTISKALTGLTPATVYYFRAKGTNAEGSDTGDILSFTTAATPPTIATGAASAVATTTATLNGTATARGATTTLTFVYGTDPLLLTGTTTVDGVPATIEGDDADEAFTAALTGLASETTYYGRARGVNSAGTTLGDIVTFTTEAVRRVITGTVDATSVVTGTLDATSVVTGTLDATSVITGTLAGGIA